VGNPNTSATGGPLAAKPQFVLGPPSGGTAGLGCGVLGGSNIEDGAQIGGLMGFFQALIVSLTGLPGNYVRPRWQQNAPVQPDISTNWCAFGQVRSSADFNANEAHINKMNVTLRNEVIELQCSFYGPQADNYARDLRDGLQVAQNREVLTLNGMGLVDTGDLTPVPEETKGRWYYRIDLPLRIRRVLLREYPVLDIESASIQLQTDAGINETINVQE